MKKLSLVLGLFISVSVTQAQLWFDLGIKGGFTPGTSLNSNIFNDGNYTLKFAPGYQFGGKVGINFNPEHAVAIEGLLTTIQTKTAIKDADPTTLKLNYLEIPILYRYNKENGGYSEIGPVIGMIQSATGGTNSVDVKDQFSKNTYGLMLGFGQYIGGGNLFGLNLGFRISYTFTDIINSDYQSSFGNAVYQPTDVDSFDSFEYKASNNIYAGIVMEFNFNLGYFVKGSGCHKNTRFKLF